jgi:YVTN family beta-propeller protein
MCSVNPEWVHDHEIRMVAYNITMRTTLIALLLLANGLLAGTSNSLLDLTPDGRRLAVANTDQGTVSFVDVNTRTKLAELPAGDHPEGVAWVGNGPLCLATVYGDDRVVLYDADAKRAVAIIPMADEPYGIVTTPDGKFAYVSHDYPGTVSEIEIATRTVTRTFSVGENCRGIALSHDSKTLYVTEFLTAKLIAVEIASGRVVDSWPTYESSNLCRSVTLHPTRPKAYLPHQLSRVNMFDARGSIFPRLSYCDLVAKPAGESRRRAADLDTYNGVIVMANPWETALSPDGKKLYILYSGTNDANVSSVIDDDYRESTPDRIVKLGRLPRAIRVHPNGREVYISNAIDCEVGIYDAALRPVSTIPVTTPAQSPEWFRGKELFESARRPMGGTGWVSCSGCHPSGLSDGRVWQNPEGHRRTPHLFGLAHTHPLHWSADRDESQDFEYTIRGKLMRGRGLFDGEIKPRTEFLEPSELDMPLSGKSKDLDALAVYTNSFPVRMSPHAVDGKLSAAAERGKTIFFDTRTQCASCHSGPYYSDSQLAKPFKLHDVGTGGDAAIEKMGPKFDTPMLLGVYRMGPYLHDGSARTLTDVLTKRNVGDRHGVTSHLNAEQVKDLVAFLKSLPYEPLPDATANTVKDRIPLKFPRPTIAK